MENMANRFPKTMLFRILKVDNSEPTKKENRS